MNKKHFLVLTMIIATCALLMSCQDGHVHQWTSAIEKEPGCETTGTVVKTCPCGAVERETVQPLGHEEGVEKIKTPATCTEKGEIEVVCPRCGKVFSTKSIEAKGHTPATDKVIVEPTCTTAGKETTVCKDCGVQLGEREIPATGHSKNLLAVEKTKATCETEGVMSMICPKCMKEVETKTIPALGHDWEELVVDKAATCTATGHGTRVCKRDTSHVLDVTIPMIPHDFSGESVVTKKSTCKEHGVITTKCKYCDATQTSELELAPHVFSEEWKQVDGIDVTPTEFTPGIKIRRCLNCDYCDEITIPPLHKHDITHIWWDEENILGNNIPSTCAKQGRIMGYCSCYVDGEGNIYEEAGDGRTRYKLDEKDAPFDLENHEHIEKQIVKQADYFSGNIYKKVCTACTKLIENNIVEGDAVPPVGTWDYSITTKMEADNPFGKPFITENINMSLYDNGVSIYTYTVDGTDYYEIVPAEVQADNKFTYRTIDGKWTSKWQTMSTPDMLQISKDAVPVIAMTKGCSVKDQTIVFSSYGEGDSHTSHRVENPDIDFVIAIEADNLSTAGSFSVGTDGNRKVTVDNHGTVKLTCIPTITSTAAPHWTIDGNPTADDAAIILESVSSDMVITCTLGDYSQTFHIVPNPIV